MGEIMSFNKSKIARGILLAGLSSTITVPALSAVLEEVVVTAQKRAQSVNDIGVSATAFAGESLRELGVDQPVDLGAMTPGLITVNSTSGGTPIFAIRGIGLDDFNANNTSGVGVYTDEVFASSPLYLGGQLFDIDRVEVLKGPQGTLYGKNTTGGAINFVTHKPTDELEGYVEAGYGRYDTLELTAVVSGPLSDSIRGRLAADYVKSGEGWQEDVETGKEYGELDRFGLRGQLAFDLGDDGEALLRAYYSQDDSKPLTPDSEGIGDALFLPRFNVLNSPSDPAKVKVGGLAVDRDEGGSGVALTINYSLESFDFVSISAFDQYERVFLDNYDGAAIASTDTSADEELEQWSQEFRLVSNADGAFSWIAGINISSEEVVQTSSYVDDSFLVTDSVFFGELDPADISAAGLDIFAAEYIQETDSYGIYLHTETELGDALTLIAGLRYSYDDRSFRGSATNISFGDTFPVEGLDDSEDNDAITGKIGLDWRVNDDLLVFGNVATSYKAGVYYAGATLDSSAWGYVDPEDILSYELGFKWTLLDGSMQLNGSLFRMEYEDRGSLISFVADDFSNFVTLFATPDVTLVTIPESTSQGFELDMSWLPTDGLTLAAGVAYLDTEVSKTSSQADMRGINPDPGVNDDATGDLNFNGIIDDGEVAFVDALTAPMEKGTILSQAPEWSYNAMAAYEFGLGNGLLARLQGSYSWVDRQFSQLADPNAESDAVSALNAQASIASQEGKWTLILWGRNITDEDSDTYSFTNFAGRTVYRQQPATYGVTLNYQLW